MSYSLPPEQIHQLYQLNPQVLSGLDDPSLRGYCESLSTDELVDLARSNRRFYNVCREILERKTRPRTITRPGKSELG